MDVGKSCVLRRYLRSKATTRYFQYFGTKKKHDLVFHLGVIINPKVRKLFHVHLEMPNVGIVKAD